MIKVLHQSPGEYVPFLVCDVCGKRIENAGSGVALTMRHPLAVGEESKVLHVHEGVCYATAEGHVGHRFGHEPIGRHFLHLLHNVGLSPGQLPAFDLAGPDWNRAPMSKAA